MKILGFQKLTLLDYPGKVACTIFIGGCNFRCPFCHNADLVLNPNKQEVIAREAILATLRKRQGILDGVCITGGEPTLAPQLKPFLKEIKALGYPIKLDTNGYQPEVLSELVNERLIDYVAMDIKNSPLKYAKTSGVSNIDMSKIQTTIDFLKRNYIDYEFRTTLTRELQSREDIHAIGELISGCKRYFLQAYQESQQVIKPIFTSYTKEELQQFQDELREYIEIVEIRGP